MGYTEHYIFVEPDVRLHYIDEGEGQPLIFITGFSGNAENFVYQIDFFRKYFRVISIDPRNHGKSSFSDKNTYAQQGHDLGIVIEKLGLKNVILAGWSFGALACLNYLEEYGTENVAAYITIDNPPLPITEDASEYRAGDLNMLRDFHFRYFISEEGYIKFVNDNFIDGIFFIDPPKDQKERDKVMNSALRLPLKAADDLILDGHLSDKRVIQKKVCEAMPTLFFVAKYREEEGLRCLKRDYPSSQVVSLKNHMCFYEAPDEFNRILYDFLKKNGFTTA